jgi:hypothetical protein
MLTPFGRFAAPLVHETTAWISRHGRHVARRRHLAVPRAGTIGTLTDTSDLTKPPPDLGMPVRPVPMPMRQCVSGRVWFGIGIASTSIIAVV